MKNRSLQEIFNTILAVALLAMHFIAVAPVRAEQNSMGIPIYSSGGSYFSAQPSNIFNINPSIQESNQFVINGNKYAPGEEIIEKRTENSKTYFNGNGQFTAAISSGPIHYKDDYSNRAETWKDIDLTMVNGKITKAPYELTVDGFSVIMRDKKTGSVTNLTLLSVGTDSKVKLPKASKVDLNNKVKLGKVDSKIDVEIEATNTGVRFKRIIASVDADHSANFEVKQTGIGIKISSEARDTKGNVKVDSSIQNGILTESISSSYKSKVSYPLEIDPTLTAYGTTADCTLQARHATTYNTAWTNTSGQNLGVSDNQMWVGQYLNGGEYYVNRGYVFFDTSSLTSDAIITATNFVFQAWSLGFLGSSETLEVTNGQPTYPHNPVEVGDINKANYSGAAGTAPTVPNTANGEWYYYYFNSTGIGWISKTGTTKFCLRSGDDMTGTAPGSFKTIILKSKDWTSAYYLSITYSIPAPPTVTTTAASSIGLSSAILCGSITDLSVYNVTKYGIQYGTSAAYGSWVNSTETKTTTFSFVNTTTGLTNSTLYYYRAFAVNTNGTGYGTQTTFSTLTPGPPTVTTSNASSVTIDTAVLNGSVTDTGNLNITKYGFQYGTTVAYGSWINSTETKTSTFSFTNTTTGLNSTTLYYYRSWAINSIGIGYGAQSSFSTATPSIPTVTVQAATAITNVTVTGNGNIGNLGGYSNCSARGFDYGTSSGSYPSSAVDSAGGYLTGAYTKSITGLSPGTLYYYRAQATNPTGIGNSSETTFLTIPNIPIGFTATGSGDIEIDLSWTKGTGAGYTLIRYKTTGYPNSTSDGTQIYLNTGTSYAHTPVSVNNTYYYSAWSQTTSGGITQYSSPVNMTATPTITAPQVTTSSATVVTYSGSHQATLNGEITSTGGSTLTCDYKGFVYGTISRVNPGNTTAPGPYASNWTLSGSFTAGSFSYTATGLVANTLHYYRAFAHNSQGWTYGDEQSFTTLGAPAITISSVTNLATSSAQLNAILSTDGNQACDVRFGYDNVTRANFEDYASKTIWINDTYSTGGFPYATVSGLSIGTTYYYRAQVKNDFANATSSELTFTTSTSVFTPTNLIAVPYSSSVILSWTKGSGSTTTYIMAKTGQYPLNVNDGTLVCNITSATTTYSGLLPGTTYFFRAWGWSGGVYSLDNATAITTTTAGSSTNTTTVAQNTTLGPGWYRNTTITGFADNPISPIVTNIYDAYEVPETTIWMFLSIILSMAAAIWIYSQSSNLVLSAMALAAGIGFSAIMGLLPMWTLFAMILFALAIIVISTRYGG